MIVYLNGEYLPEEKALVPVDDRGFLFGDGVYEVFRTYHGRFFEIDAHLARLSRSLGELRIGLPSVAPLRAVAEHLLAENDVGTPEAKVYIQITRGVAPREHRFPPGDVAPTVYACSQPLHAPEERQRDGLSAIMVSDTRWARCDIKSLMLLPNVLAYQQALDADAQEAIFVRDGFVTEASHNSAFAVMGGVVVTAPLSNLVLPGITREVVLRLCEAEDIPVEEFPVAEDRFLAAEEVFVTGTSAEVTPVVRLDGRPVGNGEPGAVTRRLQGAFRTMVAALDGKSGR